MPHTARSTSTSSSKAADAVRQKQLAAEVANRVLWLHDSYIAEAVVQLLGNYPCFPASEAGRTTWEVRRALLEGLVAAEGGNNWGSSNSTTVGGAVEETIKRVQLKETGTGNTTSSRVGAGSMSQKDGEEA